MLCKRSFVCLRAAVAVGDALQALVRLPLEVGQAGPAVE
jgi:hypothetical protein